MHTLTGRVSGRVNQVIYTVGHGDRTLDSMLTLIRQHEIKTLVDVRAQPHSTRFPYFSQAPLREALEDHGIVYHWAGRQLGGQVQAQPNCVHTALAEGLRGFAEYMQTEPFARAVQQLLNLATRDRLCILCAEHLPEHCHRSLISDYLILQGVEVLHIVSEQRAQAHQLNPLARRESQALIYDRGVNTSLEF